MTIPTMEMMVETVMMRLIVVIRFVMICDEATDADDSICQLKQPVNTELQQTGMVVKQQVCNQNASML